MEGEGHDWVSKSCEKKIALRIAISCGQEIIQYAYIAIIGYHIRVCIASILSYSSTQVILWDEV